MRHAFSARSGSLTSAVRAIRKSAAGSRRRSPRLGARGAVDCAAPRGTAGRPLDVSASSFVKRGCWDAPLTGYRSVGLASRGLLGQASAEFGRNDGHPIGSRSRSALAWPASGQLDRPRRATTASCCSPSGLASVRIGQRVHLILVATKEPLLARPGPYRRPLTVGFG